VYVWRKRDADALAEQLLGASIEGGVVSYHGGMDSGQRERAQGLVSITLRSSCPCILLRKRRFDA